MRSRGRPHAHRGARCLSIGRRRRPMLSKPSAAWSLPYRSILARLCGLLQTFKIRNYTTYYRDYVLYLICDIIHNGIRVETSVSGCATPTMCVRMNSTRLHFPTQHTHTPFTALIEMTPAPQAPTPRAAPPSRPPGAVLQLGGRLVASQPS